MPNSPKKSPSPKRPIIQEDKKRSRLEICETDIFPSFFLFLGNPSMSFPPLPFLPTAKNRNRGSCLKEEKEEKEEKELLNPPRDNNRDSKLHPPPPPDALTPTFFANRKKVRKKRRGEKDDTQPVLPFGGLRLIFATSWTFVGENRCFHDYWGEGGKKGENAIIPIRYYRNKKSGKGGERGWTNWAGKGKKEKGRIEHIGCSRNNCYILKYVVLFLCWKEVYLFYLDTL